MCSRLSRHTMTATSLGPLGSAFGNSLFIFGLGWPYALTHPAPLRFLEHTMRDFRRAGLTLSQEDRDKVEALDKKISQAGVKFSQNIAEDDTKLYASGLCSQCSNWKYWRECDWRGGRWLCCLPHCHTATLPRRSLMGLRTASSLPSTRTTLASMS